MATTSTRRRRKSPAAPLVGVAHQRFAVRERHRIYIFDPSGEKPPELVYATDCKMEAKSWLREWQRDPLNLCAILWPEGAPPPHKMHGPRKEVAHA